MTWWPTVATLICNNDGGIWRLYMGSIFRGLQWEEGHWPIDDQKSFLCIWHFNFFMEMTVQMGYLKCIFLCFEAVFGLKNNPSKLVPIGDVPRISALAEILGYKIFALLLKYLRLPLGARDRSKEIWDQCWRRRKESLQARRSYIYQKEAKTPW